MGHVWMEPHQRYREAAKPSSASWLRELPTGHVLTTLPGCERSLGGFDCDDVAFEVKDGRRCVVHLTWRVGADPD
jgi:hypothetical protein